MTSTRVHHLIAKNKVYVDILILTKRYKPLDQGLQRVIQ